MLLLALLLALIQPEPSNPAVTTASTTPVVHAYRTYLRDRFQSVGFAGELRLTFADDGSINGTYRQAFGGRLLLVHGARQGSHVWIDVPTLGNIHIEGTLAESGISGIASPIGPQPKQYIFTATPDSSPAP
jgi:hypothetical protein